ncbi:MAG TPA: PspC domain-containing protein [Allosphingosinicella sp.]|nr:PspC domain-containing protein [Allosphingosinicella sp.]
MQTSKGNLFTRDDTFFGVCEGLGEDLRIPSNLFRVAFALGFFFSPQGAVITYAALGVLVLVSRLVFPAPRAARRSPVVAEVAPRAEPTAANVSDEQMDLDLLPVAA